MLMIAGPAWALQRRTLRAATSTPCAGTQLSLEAFGPQRMTATAQASGHTTAKPKAVDRCSSPSVGRGPKFCMVGIRPQGSGHVKQRYMLSVMCGRSTYKLTWEEIVALY